MKPARRRFLHLAASAAASFPGQPMSRADVERKFRGNVGKAWPPERTAAILEALWALERTPDLRALLLQLSLDT